MIPEKKHGEAFVLRTVIIVAMILLAAAARIAPHPWNFTPVGAMALFGGAMLKDRRAAFLLPLLALLVGDVVIGFHKLMPVVYASFLINVGIGHWLRERRSLLRVGGATLFGAVQFFLITNFAVWALEGTYPRTAAGLAACCVAGIPYFRNALAGDGLYAALLFGGFSLAECIFPAIRSASAKEA